MSNIKSNRLWLARKCLGYEQKQVAKLLAQKGTNQISRYEIGINMPSLKTALKLSIIYKLPVRVLFQKYYRECWNELTARAENLKQDSKLKLDLTEPTDYCAYLELLKTSFLSEIDKRKIDRHTLMLMNERNNTRTPQ
jgi:transcriptional regulator with XRE-family HTH domain